MASDVEVGAALGPLFALAWWCDVRVGRGGVMVFVVIAMGLLIEARFYSAAELSILSAALQLVAPHLVWVMRIRKGARWMRVMMAIVLAAIPLGIAVGLALREAAVANAEF